MFGSRRRRPILGTALVIGASRASARHEIERQAVAEQQRAWEIDRAAEEKNRRKQEQDLRDQRIAEEAALRAAAVTASAVNTSAPAPPVVHQVAQSPGQSSLNPGPAIPRPRSATPAYTVQNNGPNLQPATQSIQYCPVCGSGCDITDRFCRTCGNQMKRA